VAGLEEIWSSTAVQEVLKTRIIDLNDLSLEQSEATLMMICPVIKCKADGKYIIGLKLKSIIKQGNNLILKQGVSGSAECFKEYIGKNARD